MALFYIFIIFLALVFIFLVIKTNEVENGRKFANKKYLNTEIDKFTDYESISKISILPIVDSESINENLKTENGVSYLISADNEQILLDFGFNRAKKHPSPLLHNMNLLEKSFDEIDYIVFSHAHLDHLGGIKEQKSKTFSISQAKVDTPKIPIFSPVKISPSEFNLQLNDIKVTENPTVISKGIYTIGNIPRHLFIMGYVEEQALAIRLNGKGIVLIVGCGHQTIQKIIERTKKLFDDNIYAVFGGLHFPILKKGGINLMAILQYVVGSDYAPWEGLKEKDVFDAIEILKAENVQHVGLSPHDSS
ncbi:MAG: MBL fold metallo-hydrolase, partial [Bacteroidales bacterium]|nr:MBL fold metallo-hydrolase [Bacteroidales bacterium]